MVKSGFEPRQFGFGAQIFNLSLTEDSFSLVWNHKGSKMKTISEKEKGEYGNPPSKKMCKVGMGRMSLTTTQ